nr:hypothetical protein Iba_chr12fCG16850 [Ipomoea batatas]GME05445.1 hypothetical protein Iba_scaffold2902CG0010 [Ipomoea batatas]
MPSHTPTFISSRARHCICSNPTIGLAVKIVLCNVLVHIDAALSFFSRFSTKTASFFAYSSPASLITVSPPILPLTLSRLSPCLVSNIGRGVRCIFTCTKSVKLENLSCIRSQS